MYKPEVDLLQCDDDVKSANEKQRESKRQYDNEGAHYKLLVFSPLSP